MVHTEWRWQSRPSRRRYEVVFEFVPTSDELTEAFWAFSIPSQGIRVPLLLVGRVTEPRISLDRPAINFGQVRRRLCAFAAGPAGSLHVRRHALRACLRIS